MEIITTHGTFEETIASSDVHIQAIARRLRNLIVDIYPEVTEVAWPNQQIIGYGVGPKKMSEHFCYIGLYRKHVNLGFYHGANLSDPEGILDGSGKKLRHIKLRNTDEVAHPAVTGMLKSALEERREALGK